MLLVLLWFYWYCCGFVGVAVVILVLLWCCGGTIGVVMILMLS